MSASDSPSFIESFGFHLAVNLLGIESVSKAINSSSTSRLYWRSPLRVIETADSGSHVYFIDATFDFVTEHNCRMMLTKFGALVKNLGPTSMYLQSSPWTLSDLESYANGTGICVDETGPQGMAETVAVSLTDLRAPMLKSGEIDDCTMTRTTKVAIFHSGLLEQVNLITAVEREEEKVGPSTLAMMIEGMKDDRSGTSQNQTHSPVPVVDQNGFNTWKMSYPRLEESKATSGNVDANASDSIHDEGQSEISQRGVHGDDTAAQNDGGEVQSGKSSNKRTIEETSAPASPVRAQASVPAKKPVRRQGPARKKIRKKVKMTFGKL